MNTIDRTQALKLIGDLASSSIRAYIVANGLSRGSSAKACIEEEQAAKKLFKAITGREATDQEIEEVLGL